MELATLKDLYIDELKDLYSAETQLTEALPKMAEASADSQLKNGFETHLAQTEEHVSRLKTIIAQLGETPTGKTCKAMKGLIAEGAEIIKEDADPDVKDAGLISAAQRVEHYEMAGYGTLVTYAQQLGEDDAVALLKKTLAEEDATDKKLSKLAVTTINLKAQK